MECKVLDAQDDGDEHAQEEFQTESRFGSLGDAYATLGLAGGDCHFILFSTSDYRVDELCRAEGYEEHC